MSNAVHFLLLTIFCIITTSYSQDSTSTNSINCITDDGVDGLCVPKKECSHPQNTTPKLCGNQQVRVPHVCCPPQPAYAPAATQAPTPLIKECKTIREEPGRCINIRNCPSEFEKFKQYHNNTEYISYLQTARMLCGNIGTNICCPLSDFVYSSPTTTPRPRPTTTEKSQTEEQMVNELIGNELACGNSNSFSRNIPLETVSSIDSWPWLALLGYANVIGDISFKCGGSLISKRHILTAAHCVRSDLALVRLGEYNTTSTNETRTYDLNILKAVPHEQYKKRDGRNDIAILHLENNVEFNYSVQRICLPIFTSTKTLKATKYGYQNVTEVGWRTSLDGSDSTPVPIEVGKNVIPDLTCNNVTNNTADLSTLICAWKYNSICYGDSGGPLMVHIPQSNQRRYYQIGITSHYKSCKSSATPTVYTYVEPYIDWIKEQIVKKF